MKRVSIALALVFLTLCAVGWAQDKQEKKAEEKHYQHAPAPSSPEWQQLKSLVGNWEGTMK